MQKRTVALIAASVAAAAVTATGVTYASAAGSSPESASVREAVLPASAPLGGDDHEWKDGEKKDDYKKDDYKKDDNGYEKHRGEIQINERTYSAHPGACITVFGAGSSSFNITNDTDRTVEFFNGGFCNEGTPVATVGPDRASFGVGDASFLASFRVVD
ncbi:hypothetical protein [Streptomyces ipomoeae]|uniref:Secreted protein n=1 Tax=Streptomyces ipomoeae 91-03 TaxID=698759 RepID=L1L1N0_9ACTN|nr:hypothetical protein [Streptomyces ipomoeae]EKX66605.1 hypothetical protein STRIP9103_04088 [Streptomyces ipomoeae 91-03]MDX2700510.1 hypothetical protein [Streptomyces ipomoeae]MDX2846166.1 hypothetical protein [Streptomyces ipomoeae]MDX2932864.1 hypothetical protein [Streptomyces ipomoeae]TQE17795.1 hypothetical protein Sipo7851_47010 [Streptomyces ipomoeae]